ncbi:hypothetical protein BKA63DRAFT_206347 [Paraphoma chrysanthemicola]|nr:hypothetical protein BKA63DRAFT_206347 [Paraphoma chrysanthemicola]
MEAGWQPLPPAHPPQSNHARVDSHYTLTGPVVSGQGASGATANISPIQAYRPISQQAQNTPQPMPKGKGQMLQGSYHPPTNSEHFEKMDQSYFVRPKSFFYEGRVFAVMMNETAGASITDYNSSKSINPVKYMDNLVYTNVRRFVVVRQRREFCFACPIFTYSGRATTKRGVRAAEHGIAFSWGGKEQLLPSEFGITKPSMPVVMAEHVSALDVASRIYYGIHHPIQYNVKVKEIGYVPNDYIPTLIGNWKEEDDNDTKQSSTVTDNAEIPEEDE